MGYYSTVAYRIRFKDKIDTLRFIDALGHDVWGTALPYITWEGVNVTFREDWIKWPTLFDVDVPPEYVAIQAIVDRAQEFNAAPEDDPDYIPSSGFFARVGEEYDDVDMFTWDGDSDILPYGGDLGFVRRDIVLTAD